MLATGAMADARAWNKAGITNHVKDSKRRPVSNLRVQSASPVRESSPQITLGLINQPKKYSELYRKYFDTRFKVLGIVSN